MPLIGTKHWNPHGESMFSIVTKMVQLNHLDWLEERRWFGTKDLNSFATGATQNFDNPGQFNVASFARVAGWDPNLLKAAFSSFYEPPWQEGSSGTMSKEVRACLSCWGVGSHLAVHQLSNWSHCPIHEEPIVTQCPHCQFRLGDYRIDKPQVNRGYCHGCNAQLFVGKAHSQQHQERRLQFMSEYEEWMRDLKSSLVDKDSRYQWINGEVSMKSMCLAHLLVPAPNWINCMSGSKSMKTSSWLWEGTAFQDGLNMRAHRISKQPSYMSYRPDGSPRKSASIEEDFKRIITQGVLDNHVRLVESLDVSKREAGIFELNSSDCTSTFGEMINAWESAYWMWRRSLDEAFPLRNRWARSMSNFPIESSWLWSEWVSSVGQLIWSPLRNMKHPRNTAIVRWLTDIWLTRLSDEAYSRFVGVACRCIGGDWMQANHLHIELEKTGSESVWALERLDSGQTKVHALSTIAPFGEFRELKRSGFKGNDGEYCESFERLNPLISLLGTDAISVEKWRQQWRDVRDYHAMREQHRSNS